MEDDKMNYLKSISIGTGLSIPIALWFAWNAPTMKAVGIYMIFAYIFFIISIYTHHYSYSINHGGVKYGKRKGQNKS